MIQANFRGSFLWLMSQCKHETGVEHLCAMVTCCRYSAKFAVFLALRQKQTSQLIHLRNSIFQLNRRFCVAHLIDYWKTVFNSFSSCRNNFNWAEIKFANDLRSTSCHCALVFMSFLRLFKASGGVGYFYDQNNRNLRQVQVQPTRKIAFILRSIKLNKNNLIRNNSRRNRREKREIDCVETESGENYRLMNQTKAKASQKSSRLSPKLIEFIAVDSFNGW